MSSRWFDKWNQDLPEKAWQAANSGITRVSDAQDIIDAQARAEIKIIEAQARAAQDLVAAKAAADNSRAWTARMLAPKNTSVSSNNCPSQSSVYGDWSDEAVYGDWSDEAVYGKW